MSEQGHARGGRRARGAWRATTLALLAWCALTPALARAQELTPEEREELKAALGEDAKAREKSRPNTAPKLTPGAAAASPGATPSASWSAPWNASSSSGGASANPNISVILDTAAAWFDTEAPLQLGGHDPNRTGFTLQQLELHIESNVDPYFLFTANIVFSLFGVEVEEAYARTLSLPWNLQARAGQFLTPFGRLNPTHPHSWSFLDQPLANGKFFGGEGSRGVGAEVSWLSPLPWFAELTVATNMASVGASSSRSFIVDTGERVRTPADLLYTTRLLQSFDLGTSWTINWGLSGQFGPNASGRGNRSEIYGSDVYVRWRPPGSQVRESVSLHAELMHRRRQLPGDVLTDWGGFAQLIWQPHFRWGLGARYERVTGLPNDPLDPDWDDTRQRISAQGTFYPSHFSRMRLQLGRVIRPSGFPDGAAGWSAMFGLEVLVGAHGAHEF